MGPPKREVEIKLRVSNLRAMLARLRELRARKLSRTFEQNTLFDTPRRSLAKRGLLLRLRRESSAARQRATLTCKGPTLRGRWTRYKIRKEQEEAVRDPAAVERALLRLGLRPSFRYEKYRTRYRLPDLPGAHLELDETPIGVFFELEGTPRAIDRAARRLGYARRDYLTLSYLGLYLRECRRRGVRPRNMVFARRKRRKK